MERSQRWRVGWGRTPPITGAQNPARFPVVFIEPDTVPAYLPPMSMHAFGPAWMPVCAPSGESSEVELRFMAVQYTSNVVLLSNGIGLGGRTQGLHNHAKRDYLEKLSREKSHAF